MSVSSVVEKIFTPAQKEDNYFSKRKKNGVALVLLLLMESNVTRFFWTKCVKICPKSV